MGFTHCAKWLGKNVWIGHIRISCEVLALSALFFPLYDNGVVDFLKNKWHKTFLSGLFNYNWFMKADKDPG